VVTIGVIVKPISGDMFFDAESVNKRISAAERRKLSQLGAFTRTTARQSIKPAAVRNRKEIRRAKKLGHAAPEPEYIPSREGEPERTRRAGNPIKKILFGYEDNGPDGGGNVAIGYGLAFGGQTGVPLRLEKGGAFRIKKTGRIVRTGPRPALQLALEKEKTKAGMLFSASL
jgi:hypothetical protein